MALSAAQLARLDELLADDDRVPLPDQETARRVQALLVPTVPRPSLAEVTARSRNRSDTDPTWRVDYSG